MYTFILIIYVILAVFIISIIMLQQSKGAEAGALGGSGVSGTLFGSSGAGNFLSKLTTICCFIFFVLSLVIANINSNGIQKDKNVDPFENIQLPSSPTVIPTTPKEPELPTK